MNYERQYRFRLLARNEGKIKSYESCNDIRAWSHDVSRRDRYLRDWMKCDMPFCIMPVCTLTGFLRTMTCRSRGRVTQRCHPDCKSKVLLESICNSCNAMKECLKNDDYFEKYFVEEELETSHWPCERCLEALKSIKMFWKVIVEKVFNVKIPKKADEVFVGDCCRTNSVREVAKIWQRDMVQQALLLKTISPQLSCTSSKSRISRACCKTCPIVEENIGYVAKPRCLGDGSILSRKTSKNTLNSTKSQRTRVLISDRVSTNSNVNSCEKRSRKKHCRCTSVRVRTMDVGCDTCNLNRENEQLEAYRINLEFLQKGYDAQKSEINKLKDENNSLKVELRNVHNNCKWKTAFYCPVINHHDNDNFELVPKPFESCLDNTECPGSAKDIDSEMIITMKNCKNEDFGHVSLLQVVHKTKDSILKDYNNKQTYCKNQDPMHLLTKVQNTLEAMVRREMSIISGKSQCEKKFDIKATFQRVNTSRSAPSCSTMPASWPSDVSNLCI